MKPKELLTIARLSLCLCGAACAHAQTTRTWNGSASTDWFNPANWTPNGAPGTNDILSVNSGTVNLSSPVTVNGQFNWSGGSLTGNPLTITSNGTFNLSGSSAKFIRNAVTNAGTTTWSGTGTLEADYNSGNNWFGHIENLPGALWDIQTDEPFYRGFGTESFRNAGTLRKSVGTGTTAFAPALLNSGAVAVLQGTLSLQDGGTIEGAFSAATGAILNLSGGGFSYANAPTLSGPGTLEFTGGNLTLVNDMIPNLQLLGGTLSLGPNFQGGTVTNLTLRGVTLTGSYIVAGALNCSAGTEGAGLVVAPGGVFNWSGGIVGGPLTIANNGVFNISGSSAKFIRNAVTNAGITTWSGTGTLEMDYSSGKNWFGHIENLPGALWDIQTDEPLRSGFGTESFRNAGTLRKSAGTGTTTFAPALLNSRAVSVLQGTLSLQDGGVIEGAFSAATGAILNLSGGGFSYANAPTLSGAGTLEFTGGNLTLVNDIIPNLQLLGGTLSLGPSFQGGAVTNLSLAGTTLTGSYVVNGVLNTSAGTVAATLLVAGGVFNWSGGTIGGPLTVASNGVFNISGSSAKFIRNAVTNGGTTTWSGTGTLEVDYSTGNNWFGHLENLPGALWDIQTDEPLRSGFGSESLRNTGTLRKSAGTGTSTLSLAVANSGTIDAQSGTLSFQGSPAYSQTGGLLNFGLRGAGSAGHLTIAGNEDFTGTLSANVLNGFVPHVGDLFTLATYGSYSGAFDAFSLASVPSGSAWQVSYGTTALKLQLVAETNSALQISGAVTRTFGHPVPNITVFAYTTNAPSLYVTATTDAGGNYVLNVTNGIWIVGLQSPAAASYNPVSTQIAVVSNTSQTVSFIVVPTTPPPLVLGCTDLTISGGSPLPGHPQVLDGCCSNVSFTLLGSTTNGSGCGQVIYQTWQAVDCCTNATCTRVVTVVPQPPIWAFGGQPQSALVAGPNTPIPGGSGTFTSFLPAGSNPNPLLPPPQASGSNVLFWSAGFGGQQGLYAWLSAAGLTTIADTNTAIPGGHGNFVAFLPSSNNVFEPNPQPWKLDENNILFWGQGTGGQQGFHASFGGTNLVKVADLNTAIPGGSGSFVSFLSNGTNVMLNPQPLPPGEISGSNILFWGAGNGGQQGLYTSLGGTGLARIADTSTAIPGGSGNFVSFLPNGTNGYEPWPQPWKLSGNNILLWGQGTGGQQGFYASLGGAGLVRIADTNTAIPGGSGSFVSFLSNGANVMLNPQPLPPEISGSNVVFWGVGAGGQQGLYASWGETNLVKVADTNTPIPGGTGRFATFVSDGTNVSLNPQPLPPKISGNLILFWGAGHDGHEGLYAALGETNLIKLVDTSTAIPGGSGTFTNLRPNGTNVSGEPNPQPWKITGNKLLFYGEGPGGQQGFYGLVIPSPGGGDPVPFKILDTNSTLEGKQITRLESARGEWGGGKTAYLTRFADGSAGLYTLDAGALFNSDSTNVTIQCGSPMPEAPTAFSPCCGSNLTVRLVGSVTNNSGCGQTILQTWQAVGCCSDTANCTRSITIAPTPPVFVCTNQTIYCGDPVPSTPPAVSSPCCGGDATISLLAAVTNGTACSQTILRIWRAVDCCSNSVICTQLLTVVPAPPSINVQPAGQTVAAGSSVTFAVTATGSPPLGYLWRFNGDTVATGPDSTLTLVNVQTQNAGHYYVLVTNAAGFAFSQTVTLAVSAPPALTVQPKDTCTRPGCAAVFSVAAVSTDGLLGFQWRYNGVDLPGATNATYTVAEAEADQGGLYSVQVSNAAGSVLSRSAILNVCAPPAIMVQPAALSVAPGGSATLSVSASGTSPLVYQWRMNGTNLPGATNATYTIPQTLSAHAGTYDVVVGNSLGWVTSQPANVRVVVPPVVPLRLGTPRFTVAGIPVVPYQSDANFYYILYRGDKPTDIVLPVAMALGTGTPGELTDPHPLSGTAAAFYRVAGIPIAEPLDTDHDGMDDVYELRHPPLNPLDGSDALKDDDGDGASNLVEYQLGTDPEVPQPLLQSVVCSKFDICQGEELEVTVTARHPTDPAGWVNVSINGYPGSHRFIHFMGLGGPRIINVVASTAEGFIQSTNLYVNVQTNCPPLAYHDLSVTGNRFHPFTAEFVVLNAGQLGSAGTNLLWDFGDGTIETTTLPHVSHSYESSMDGGSPYQAFLVTVMDPGQTIRTRYVVTVQDFYYYNKQKGIVQPRVQTAGNMELVGGVWAGRYSLRNLEASPITYCCGTIEYRSVGPKGTNYASTFVPIAPSDVLHTSAPSLAVFSGAAVLPPTNTFSGVWLLATDAVPPSACIVACHLEGYTTNPAVLDARTSLYFQLRPIPGSTQAVTDLVTTAFLEQLVQRNWVTNPDRITDEDLHRLYLDGRIRKTLNGWEIIQ